MTVSEYREDLENLCIDADDGDDEAIEAYYQLVNNVDGECILKTDELKDFYEEIKELALEGNKYAETLMVYCIGHGVADEKNDDDRAASRNWLISAALEDERVAQEIIGKRYENGIGFVKDMEQAFIWYEKAANAGAANAMNHLAILYANGTGIEKDEVKAADNYLAAAKLGNKYACVNIASRYISGSGITANYQKAAYYYLKASEKGRDSAKKAIEEKKEVWAGLGELYYYGAGDVACDVNKAIYYAKKAANSGMVDGMHIMASIYADGRLTEKNLNLAAVYYVMAIYYGDQDNATDIWHDIWESTDSGELEYLCGMIYKEPLKLLEYKYDWMDEELKECFEEYGPEEAQPADYKACFETSASDGNLNGMYEFAECYRLGKGVELDYEKAAYWYNQASKGGLNKATDRIKNEPVIQGVVGMLKVEGRQDFNKNLIEGIAMLQSAAEKGSTTAMKCLGRYFAEGEVLENSRAYAAIYLWMAYKKQNWKSIAEIINGNSAIQYYVGWINYNGANGIGVIDIEPMKGYMKDGFEKSVKNTWKEYGLKEADYKAAVEYYTKAANAGQAVAMLKLGNCYKDGTGVDKDIPEAAKWYLKAHIGGRKDAKEILDKYVDLQYYAADCYYYGKGVKKDPSLAFDWYYKSACGNYDKAQNMVGYCLDTASGAKKDEKAAMEWYKKAAKQGNVIAQTNLGKSYYDMKDYDNAMFWFKKSAEGGYAEAMYMMGKSRENKPNKGLFKAFSDEYDMVEAVSWYTKAAEQKHEKAIEVLKKLAVESKLGIAKEALDKLGIKY